MARAGYDPREMANMFQTIARRSGGGGPEWFSDHPNPGNRYDAINREAAMLRVHRSPDRPRESRRSRAVWLEWRRRRRCSRSRARGRVIRIPTFRGIAAVRVERLSGRWRNSGDERAEEM